MFKEQQYERRESVKLHSDENGRRKDYPNIDDPKS